MIFNGRAQAAVEYLFIVALVLMVAIPGGIVFYRFSADTQAVLEASKLTVAGYKLLDTAEELYSLGAAWETVEVSFPDSIVGMTIYNSSINELSLQFDINGPSEIVFFTHVPLFNTTQDVDCTNGCELPISAGKNRIRIESDENGRVMFRLKE